LGSTQWARKFSPSGPKGLKITVTIFINFQARLQNPIKKPKAQLLIEKPEPK
jgi:hypothetical protein